MWLLDVNLPKALVDALSVEGIRCETAAGRGWRDLTNGRLVSVGEMGRETHQGEIGLVIADEYIAIREFEEE